MSDTNVYEPEIRARIGTASHKVDVLEVRAAPIGTALNLIHSQGGESERVLSGAGGRRDGGGHGGEHPRGRPHYGSPGLPYHISRATKRRETEHSVP